ncbi:MAG: outer membrane beta-barrel protein [Vicinamibacterales bacterium]
MSVRRALPGLLAIALVCTALPLHAQTNVRVVGRVQDEMNAVPLPGVPVEVVDGTTVAYTDVDGRYELNLAPGTHELRVAMEGYQPQTIRIALTAGQRVVTVDVPLAVTNFEESVNVTADFVMAETSSAAAQLIERRNAQVITDNIGSQAMRDNGDSNAANAMARVTGLSVVDDQYVFVRGLGERYSNTTLAGAVIPTTEPDKKVVPLDLFPSGLLDSVQVNKSYSPDRSADFAGGLVQIVPMKLPNQPVLDLSYGVSHSSTATGKDIPLSPLGGRDWLGFDNGARAIPGAFPADSTIVRRGIFTPELGYSAEELTAFGRMLNNTWRPQTASGRPGQNWGLAAGNRFGKLGIVASVSQSYRESYVEEQRRFFTVAGQDELQADTDYQMQFGTQRAQLGVVGNLAYQFTTNHRLSLENFYSHTGRDEGRYFEGPNFDAGFYYVNHRLQYIEEGLISNALGGEHFFQNLSSSRVDWKVNFARATRDEPDMRETLYQGAFTRNADGTVTPAARTTFVLADESQSGFRLFNELDDETVDLTLNWSVFRTSAGRATQYKFGVGHVDRSRDFTSRRFRFIPVIVNKDGASPINLTQAPEQLYASQNIGQFFRFNEETRPVDAYDGEQQTTSGYGMVDFAFFGGTRLVAGARVERFHQVVNTHDPFGLFLREVQAEIRNTDVFPSVNLIRGLANNQNVRLSYSSTVNRPEFRELAEFEFTDVVGNRAIRGNPDLDRALIQNVDARWERFLGERGILAASVFFKYFDDPIERVIVAGAQPLATFQNADKARNVGLELEASGQVTENIFLSANYTFVDSKITLRPEQTTIATSDERPLAGQSKNLFNMTAEYAIGGFATRLLFNYAGDRISDVGANEAPDVIEEGRGTLDLVFSQRVGQLGVKLNFENLIDDEYLFTQGDEEQRIFKLGRTIGLSFSYSPF